MRSTRKILFSVLFFSIVLILGIVLFQHESRSRESFAVSLQDFIIDEKTSDLSTAELRARQYALLAQFDPIFSLAGTDLEKFEVAVAELIAGRAEIIRHYEAEEQETLRSSLYPESFLTTIAETERLRRALIDEPNTHNARTYHAQLIATINTYLEEMRRLRENLDFESSQYVGFWNGTTNSTFIQPALETVEAAVEEKLAKEKRRYACLSFFSSSCDLFAHMVETKRSQTTKIPSSITNTVPEDVERNRKILHDFLVRSDNPALSDLEKPKQTRAESLIVTDSAHCGPQYDRNYFGLWWSLPEFLNAETVSITTLDDLYFNDLRTLDDEHSEALYAAGIPYAFQKLNPYLCIELGYDYGALLSSYYVWSQLKQTPIFSDIPMNRERTPIFVQELSALEKKIRSQPLVYVEEIDAFIRLAETELFTHGRFDLERLLGTARMSSLEDSISVWNAKSAWNESVISRLAFMSSSTDGILDHLDIPLGVLFLTRSHVSFLYFLGNPSVISTPPDLVQLRKEIDPKNFNLATYGDVLQSLYSPEEMVSYLLHTTKVMERVTTGRILDLP